MYLSNFQKEIVKKISSEEVKTIKDFLIVFGLVISGVTPKNQTTIGGIVQTEGDSDFFFKDEHFKFVNRSEAYAKIIDFRKVINLLSKAELIEIEQSSSLCFGYLETEDLPKEIINIIKSSERSLIICYNEIRNFEKDFRTPMERNQKSQLWVPIVVAIATVLLSSILNYFIYTKEREVFIKNTNAFSDSLYIKVINDFDSTLKDNRHSYTPNIVDKIKDYINEKDTFQ